MLVKLREGKGAPAHLVSIHELHDELDGVTLAEDGTVEIGPITWFHHVTTSPVIQATVPTLGDACDTPGGPQLRVSGTIGGNVCNAATSADSASTLFAYGALLDVVSTRGKRTIPIEEWYAGPGRSYRELEIATMGCCCLVKLGADKSTIDDIRLAFGVAAPTPMRATGAEDAVRGLPVAEAVEKIGELAQAETHPRDSWRASKDFRLQLIGEMSRRSLIEAARKGGADI